MASRARGGRITPVLPAAHPAVTRVSSMSHPLEAVDRIDEVRRPHVDPRAVLAHAVVAPRHVVLRAGWDPGEVPVLLPAGLVLDRRWHGVLPFSSAPLEGASEWMSRFFRARNIARCQGSEPRC